MKLTFKIVAIVAVIAVLSSCGSGGNQSSDNSKGAPAIDIDTTELQADSISSADAMPDSFPSGTGKDTLVK